MPHFSYIWFAFKFEIINNLNWIYFLCIYQVDRSHATFGLYIYIYIYIYIYLNGKHSYRGLLIENKICIFK